MALIKISIILCCVVECIWPCTVPSKYDNISPRTNGESLDGKEKSLKCGPVPAEIYPCLDIDFVPEEVVQICRDSKPKKTVCEHTVCIYRHSAWLTTDNKIDYKSLNDSFVQFVRAHPETKGAVRHILRKCVTPDVKPQSLFTSCPTFDILTCSMNAFIKHASKKQWKPTDECRTVAEFAKTCPLCPSECYETLTTLENNVCTPCFDENNY